MPGESGSAVSDAILSVKNVSKRFGSTQAVSDVSLELRAGEIRALVGENGAGKSTIVRMISGATRPDSGAVYVGEERKDFHQPSDALRAGIATIYQDRALVPTMTVGDNIVLGRERTRAGLLSTREAKSYAREHLAEVGLSLDPGRLVGDLSVAEQQLVAVAKALSVEARVFVFDEPTAALTQEETATLFGVIRDLKENRYAIMYISHQLGELEMFADSAIVLKDGVKVAEVQRAEVREQVLVPLMVGREIDRLFPDIEDPVADKVVMRAEGISIDGAVDSVSVDVHHGEIVGLAGLEGSGKSIVSRALAGALACDTGSVLVNGKRLAGGNVHGALALGVGYIPADRRAAGVIPEFSVRSSLTLAALEKMCRHRLLHPRSERREAMRMMERLEIRTSGIEAPTRTLSGGNQQKTVLGRALLADATVLICEEPTAGVDVGARAEIYDVLARLAERGAGIVISSSDALELIGMCHRILVLSGGVVVREFTKDNVTEEELVRSQFLSSDANVRGAEGPGREGGRRVWS